MHPGGGVGMRLRGGGLVELDRRPLAAVDARHDLPGPDQVGEGLGFVGGYVDDPARHGFTLRGAEPTGRYAAEGGDRT